MKRFDQGFFSSTTKISQSPKHLTFALSIYTTLSTKGTSSKHLKRNDFFTKPLQQSNKFITLPGMTHSTSERLKSEVHNSLAKSQWRKKMIYGFSAPFKHTKPIHHYDFSFLGYPKSESSQEQLSKQRNSPLIEH